MRHRDHPRRRSHAAVVVVVVATFLAAAVPAAGQSRDAPSACPGGVPDAGFTDTVGSTFAHAIDCLAWWDVAEGRTATRFVPNSTVTRRQMAMFLHRFVAETAPPLARDPGGGSPFPDVPDTGTGSLEIRVLASLRSEGVPLVEGHEDGTFRPTRPVTRAQMASFLTRTIRVVAAHHDVSLATSGCPEVFPDRDRVPAVHRPAVVFVCAHGIAEGRSDGTYGPQRGVTRGQMAAFVTRSLEVFVGRGVVSTPSV